MLTRARKFLDVRPGEGLPLAVACSYVALAVGSFLLARPIRNGLFLGEYGSSKLVYVYVAVPLVLSLLVPIYQRFAALVGERVAVTTSLLFLASNVVVFWWAIVYHQAAWLAAAFYVWVNCYGAIAPVQAWMFASEVFDARQARRLFGLVGSGASFGAIMGGVLAGWLVGPLGTVNLLLVLASLIAASAVVVNLGWRLRRRDIDRVGPQATASRDRSPLIETCRQILATPYLRNIALLVSLVAVITLWVQFLFQAGAEQQFAGDPDRMTRFFGNFNSLMGVGALLIQIFATGPALRKFGLGVTILLLPLLLGTGIVAIALTASLWAVLLTSAFDQGLRFSIDKATFELLYLPISATTKNDVKRVIDLIFSRTADGIGAVLLGLATTGFLILPGVGLGLRGVALICLAMIVAWLWLARSLRQGYVDAIYDSITQHRLDAERAAGTVLDRTATDALASRLRDGELIEVLYALDVFRTQHRGVVHPAVRSLLQYPAPEVRSQAIAVLSEAGDKASAGAIEGLLDDADAGVRAEALLFLARHADVDPLQRVTSFADFPDYSVQAGVVAFLARESSWQNLDAARLMLQQMVADTGPTAMQTKIEAARVISRIPREFDEELEALLDDDNAEVVRAALVAAGQRKDLGKIARILPKLEDGELQEDAVPALVHMGEAAVPTLRAALEAPEQPLPVRMAVPRVLAIIGGAGARQALVDNLLMPEADLRYEVIDALADLHARHPGLGVDRQAVEMVLTNEIMGHYRSYLILGSLETTFNMADPAVQGLRHAMQAEEDRILALIDPLLPNMDMKSVAVALRSEDAGLRANALELLDNVLSPALRQLVVPLVDGQVSIDERIARAREVVTTPVQSQAEAARAMLGSENPWLRACGVYVAGALRLEALRDLIEPLTSARDPLLRETARGALRRMEAAPEMPEGHLPAAEAGAPTYAPVPSGEPFGVG
jgi:AAA family ATP:ADP antiporter